MDIEKLELTEEEKEAILLHRWENRFDVGKSDIHYSDPPMVKLLGYLGVKDPKHTSLMNCEGDSYSIEIVANEGYKHA